MPDKYGDMTQEEAQDWYKRRKNAEKVVEKRQDEWNESWKLLDNAKNMLKRIDNELIENKLKALENLKKRRK